MTQEKSFSKISFCLALLGILLVVGCDKKNEKVSSTQVSVTNAISSATNAAASAPGISGKIILKGTPPPERDLPLTAECGTLHTTIPKTRFYVVSGDGALADVFIYIKEGLSGKTFPAPGEPVLLDQIGCEYTPYVIGLQTGQKLLARNSDPLMHNVHPLPKVAGNKESNKAQMMKSPDYEYTFDNPEIFLTYKCDIHPWMYAYVAVVEHPFFAVSGKNGTFQLKNVTDGKYVVEAVHRKAGKQTKEITVTDGKSSPIEFTFEIPASP